jgi:3-keto-disaccharide hydrolase
MRRSLLFLGYSLFICIAAQAAEQGAPEGFTPLFDGKTLDGWKMVNTKDNFLVKDGILVMDKGKGWLATEKTFADFELHVRYRFVTPGADSGIFIRSSLEGSNWTNKGYQIQNMDNETLGTVIGMGGRVAKDDQSHDDNLVKKLKKPAGEWLDLTIRATGKSVTVTLNRQEIATGKNLSILDGHIGLQAEGGVLEFQRIDIKSL